MPKSVRHELQAEDRHRRNLEWQVVHGHERRANVGQILGATIILITIVAGLTAMFNGYEFGGVLLVAAAIRSPLVDLMAARPSRSGGVNPDHSR
jgi:hypothetical protein